VPLPLTRFQLAERSDTLNDVSFARRSAGIFLRGVTTSLGCDPAANLSRSLSQMKTARPAKGAPFLLARSARMRMYRAHYFFFCGGKSVHTPS
jgi:hypothetical protein